MTAEDPKATATATAAAGAAIYSPAVLRVYDLAVHGISNPLLWRCPTARLHALYAEGVSARHLDIGVGSGLMLARAPFPPRAEITLLDLSPHALAHAARRIAARAPRRAQGDAFDPPRGLGPFDSVGLCYLLHCLPGDMAAKARVFDGVARLCAPGARVFGATLLPVDAVAPAPGLLAGARRALARRLMAAYVRRGVFANGDDRAEALQAALSARFDAVSLEVVGCAALFRARARGG